MRKRIVLVLAGLTLLITLGIPLLLETALLKSTGQIRRLFPSGETKTGQIYPPYPKTSAAPVLELYWEGELKPEDIIRTTPYGVWENWINGAYEPANEMQFYTRTGQAPILAVAPGRIILASNENKSVTVAYGTQYGVTYHHIVKIPPYIKPGGTVEAGDKLGYTEMGISHDGETEAWWEIDLVYKKDDVFRTLPPYNYFSKESQAKLDELMAGATYSYVQSGDYEESWTVTEGCSWIKYLDEPEWWAGSIRVGYIDSGDTEEEFLEQTSQGWTVGDEYGRVLGPTDKCN